MTRYEYWPTTLVATNHRLPQHPTNHRAAASTAARSGADSRAFADLLEGLGARLDGFQHRAFADFVAETGWLEVFNDGPLSCFLVQLVDGKPRTFEFQIECSRKLRAYHFVPITSEEVRG